MEPFIWPFTTNKALSGPPLHRDRALFPMPPPGRGWSAQALQLTIQFPLVSENAQRTTARHFLAKY